MHISAKSFFLVGFICFGLHICSAQLLEGIYCGQQNCYDVLELTREATSSEVRKSYRRLAKKTHPDLFRDEDEKKIAEENFKALGRLYLTIFIKL